ncbi:hypothetical protein SDC9_192888 [bioreactor metagenome]|uniref:Uncharacterized protein n=1 Tax=bioreactor metagenome TaxID=1076179 RepID=A0A645I1Z0_9ZZZZ
MYQEYYYLGIEIRAGTAKSLHAELMELPEPAGLRSVIAEHGPAVIPFDGHNPAIYTVLNQSTHAGGGSLRAQRQAAAAAVFERVHFLANHLGFITESALKHLGIFKDRSPELPIAVAGKYRACRIFQIPPPAALVRENVRRPRRGREFSHNVFFVCF